MNGTVGINSKPGPVLRATSFPSVSQCSDPWCHAVAQTFTSPIHEAVAVQVDLRLCWFVICLSSYLIIRFVAFLFGCSTILRCRGGITLFHQSHSLLKPYMHQGNANFCKGLTSLKSWVFERLICEAWAHLTLLMRGSKRQKVYNKCKVVPVLAHVCKQNERTRSIVLPCYRDAPQNINSHLSQDAIRAEKSSQQPEFNLYL